MSTTWSYLLMVSLGIHAMGAGPEDTMYIPAGVYSTSTNIPHFGRIMMSSIEDGQCVFGFKPSPTEPLFTVPSFGMKRGGTEDCFVYDPSGFFDRLSLGRHFEELTKRVGLSINYTDIGICKSGDTNISLRLAGGEYPMRKVIIRRRTIQQASRPDPDVDVRLDLSTGSRGQQEGADGATAGKSTDSDVTEPSSSNKRTADTDSSSPRPAKLRTTQAEGVNMPRGFLLGSKTATQPMSLPSDSPGAQISTTRRYVNAEHIPGFEREYQRRIGPARMKYSRPEKCYQFDSKDRRIVNSLTSISRKLREKNLPGLYVNSLGVCRSETSGVLELKLSHKWYGMKAE
ncbi:hypothetical protein FOZ63_007760 [Perkinsus olseni]|uniref:Uncharacterized protein n=1 Tax=Perkinsus olseni TaxID=32597 RepID=A0A7J6RAU7_PEROL|nr:hypothetical protein FOZ63_007760 [Perkinsus olseni]